MSCTKVHVEVDSLIYPRRADILLRAEVIRAYEKHGWDFDYANTRWYKHRPKPEAIARVLIAYDRIKRDGYDGSIIVCLYQGDYVLYDGAHRLAALLVLGYEHIKCRFEDHDFTPPDHTEAINAEH